MSDSSAQPPEHRPALRASDADRERVVDILRERIARGQILPGTRLSEEAISAALGVSRNTLREAFRLLSHERLLVHQLHRGVFVRTLSAADVSDLYRVRTLVECAAVRSLGRGGPGGQGLGGLETAVEAGCRAAREERWLDVGTADLAFHQEIAALAGSARIDELMRGVLAELRLVFHVMRSPREFHEPYLARNREILTRLQQGHHEAAVSALESYLDDAEAQLLAAFAQSPGGASPASPREWQVPHDATRA